MIAYSKSVAVANTEIIRAYLVILDYFFVTETVTCPVKLHNLVS